MAAAQALDDKRNAYSIAGRHVGDTRNLAQGVYVQKNAQSVVRNMALAKTTGEKDSLIVTFGGTEAGRVEQANLLQGQLADMMLLTVSPTLTQGSDNSSLANIYRLLGQTVLVSYTYDETLWRPTYLTVGTQKSAVTDKKQKKFNAKLAAKADAAVNLALVTRLQTINAPEISDKTYGDEAFAVTATASSGLAVDIFSTTSSVCSVSNGKVNVLASGVCSLKATQAGNDDYNKVEIAFKEFSVAQKTLTATADDKTYDGKTAATLKLTGIVGSDDVSGTGIFASADKGADIVVNSLALAGAQKDNYTLGNVTELTASISPKTLTVAAMSGANLTKAYDGTTANAATLVKDTHYELAGVVGTDAVDISVTGTEYDSPNAGIAAKVTASFSGTLTGTSATNYQVTAGSFDIPATIAKATLVFTSANPGSKLLANGAVTHTFSTNVDASIVSATVAVCGYSSSTLTLNATGLCTITATPTDADNYNAASQSFGVDRLYDDRDGGLYSIVKIGTQIWMAQNLAYLPSVNAIADASNTVAKYYVYDYNGTSVSNAKANSNYTTYGVLYNWTAAMAGAASSTANPSGVKGICPTGWHLPSSAEWTTLESSVGGSSTAGTKLKSVSGWTTGGVTGTDKHGFSALPGGIYAGSFGIALNSGYWWSASELSSTSAFSRVMGYSYAYVRSNDNFTNNGLSVRCLQN